MKTVVCYLIAILLFIACNQPASTKDAQKLAGNSIPVSPISYKLSKSDLKHYSNVSAHFFDSLLAHHFNGSVLVAKNGEIVYERYTGFKSITDVNDPVDEHTAFHLASVSKTFTAMATLKLWEEGKLDINDPVSKYLIGFPYNDITIKMLLSQRSGLKNYVHYMDNSGWDKKKFLSNQDLLQYIIAHKSDLKGVPAGKHFDYCNTNYAMLALIIEKVSGQPYPTYMAKTFFEPLEMKDTYIFEMKDTARATQSYKFNNRPYPLEYLDAVYGDKNVYSTVRDLLQWDIALRSGKWFKQTTLDSAYMPYSFEKPGKRNYGLGWRMLLEPNGKKLIYHNGWWHGNRTAFIRMLDENATIIALSNNDCKRVYSSKKLCNLFGDYQQGNENFDDMDKEPLGRGGEPSSKK